MIVELFFLCVSESNVVFYQDRKSKICFLSLWRWRAEECPESGPVVKVRIDPAVPAHDGLTLRAAPPMSSFGIDCCGSLASCRFLYAPACTHARVLPELLIYHRLAAVSVWI